MIIFVIYFIKIGISNCGSLIGVYGYIQFWFKILISKYLTLLRFRGYEDSGKILSLTEVNLPLIKFTTDKITFYESKLLPGASVYRSIKSFYLKI